MKLLQLAIRVHDRGQLAHHGVEFRAGNEEIKVVVRQLRIHAIPDAAEVGRRKPGLHHGRDCRAGRSPHDRGFAPYPGSMRCLGQQHELLGGTGHQHDIRFEVRIDQRRVDRHAERLGPARDARHFVRIDVRQADHRSDQAVELLGLLIRQVDAVRVRPDGTAVVVGGLGVKRPTLGGILPVRATGGRAGLDPSDALGG